MITDGAPLKYRLSDPLRRPLPDELVQVRDALCWCNPWDALRGREAEAWWCWRAQTAFTVMMGVLQLAGLVSVGGDVKHSHKAARVFSYLFISTICYAVWLVYDLGTTCCLQRAIFGNIEHHARCTIVLALLECGMTIGGWVALFAPQTVQYVRNDNHFAGWTLVLVASCWTVSVMVNSICAFCGFLCGEERRFQYDVSEEVDREEELAALPTSRV